MRTLIFVFALTLAALARAESQQQQQQQSPPAPRPAPCAAPEFRQFDFWLGQWTVADPGGKEQGQSQITREAGGCAIGEHWAGASCTSRAASTARR